MICPVKDCGAWEPNSSPKKYCGQHGCLLVDDPLAMCGHPFYKYFKFCSQCGAIMLPRKTDEPLEAEITTNIPEDVQEELRKE